MTCKPILACNSIGQTQSVTEFNWVISCKSGRYTVCKVMTFEFSIIHILENIRLPRMNTTQDALSGTSLQPFWKFGTVFYTLVNSIDKQCLKYCHHQLTLRILTISSDLHSEVKILITSCTCCDVQYQIFTFLHLCISFGKV